MGPMRCTLACIACILVLGSCGGPGALREAERVDLFDLGFGPGESQVDFSAALPGQPSNRLSLSVKEGMAHLSSRSGGTLMRLSAYGDVLALLYDPARSGKPFVLSPADSTPSGTQGTARYALQVPGFAPEEIAADSLQRLYAADRVQGQTPVYNAAQSAWCDRIVRRFGPGGREEAPLGQEGPGGSPFPRIDRLRVTENDYLYVLSQTPTMLVAHRFAPDGTLESSLRIPRDSLPVPRELEGPHDPRRRLHSYPDALDAVPDGASPRVILKCEYIEETMDPASGAVISLEPAGSWLFVMDMRSGSVTAETRLSGTGKKADEAPLTLLGMVGSQYLLAETLATGDSPGRTGSLRVMLVGSEGMIRRRVRLDLPEDTVSVPDIEVSKAGVVSALIELPRGIRLSYWDLGAADRVGRVTR